MKSSKSYIGKAGGNGMHTAHNGGQSAKSFGKGSTSPNASVANAAPVKASGSHKGSSKY